jgi:hypothetical protein
VQGVIDAVVNRVRVVVTPTGAGDDLFVGLARSSDVATYLNGVAHRQVGNFGQDGSAWGWTGAGVTTDRAGGPPAVPPTALDIWTARSSGPGTRAVSWPLAHSDWVIVVMRADGGPDVGATVSTGARAPHLFWVAGGMVLVGLSLFAAGGYLLGRVIARTRPRPDLLSAADQLGADDHRPTDEERAALSRG